MAFSFAAASYIVALICDAFLIFFSIFHTIAFDELKTDYKWETRINADLDKNLSSIALAFLGTPSTAVTHSTRWCCPSTRSTFWSTYSSCSLASGSVCFLMFRWSPIMFGDIRIARKVWGVALGWWDGTDFVLVGMTGPGLYDPTNIMNSDTLSKGELEFFFCNRCFKQFFRVHKKFS